MTSDQVHPPNDAAEAVFPSLRLRIRITKQRISIGDGASGLSVAYIKRRKIIRLSGWYDHIVGIEGADLGLADFLTALEISVGDVWDALEGESTP